MAAAAVAQSSLSAPTTSTPAANAPPADAAAAPQTYADLLNPAMQALHETVIGLRMEKWKGGNVREEAGRDSDSIMSDLNDTLPALIQSADAAPGRVAAALPLSRNINALYAVSLRVLDAARIAGPSDQATKMQDAVNILSSANKSIYDRMIVAAAAQEGRIHDLDAQLQAQTAAAQAAAQQVKPVADCPAPPVKKAVRKKKAVAKSVPATQQGNAPAGSAPQKPQ